MRTPRRRPDPAVPRPPAPPPRGRRAHAGAPAEEAAAPASPGRGAGDGSTAKPGLRRRPATVRAKIVSLLMVPVVSLLALWGFATVSAAQDIVRLGRVRQVDAEIRTPVAAALTEIQAERRAAVRFLADPASDQASALEGQARRTDAAVRRLRLGDRHTAADTGDYRADTVVRLAAFVADAEALGSARKDVADRRATPDGAYETYTRVADAALAVEGALSGGAHPELGAEARVLLDFARAGELLSREDALLALPGARGADAQRRLTAAVESRRALTAAAAGDLPPGQRAVWESVAQSAAYSELTAAEDKALTPTATGAGAPAAAKESRGTPPGWEGAYTSIGGSLREIRQAAHAETAPHTDPLTEAALSPAGAAVLLGLAAVAVTLVISVRIGRFLVVELVSLRDSALEIAHHKLPQAMDRIRAGRSDEIDIEAEAPSGPPAEDEITQVGEALSTVHRAALGAAVERAELAGGVSGVFVNLARRSQVLVHKQLSLLDSMERRADDPGELGDLFRLDHLTTRMRRHAESLIILSGAAPGRAWRMPVPLTNVVRAAVSEIEDYPRVEVRGLAETSVAGGSVADLTHLLAELIENAAQFSPPHTKVRVSGEPVGAGYVLEVEDRGLGMGREALAGANRRIEQCEDLDLFDSDRLGLFVVSRLSARHGIRVHLRPSPYGGTTAVVLLPLSLLQGAIEAVPDPGTAGAGPAGDRRPTAAGAEPAGSPAAGPRPAGPGPAGRGPAPAAPPGPAVRPGPGPAVRSGAGPGEPFPAPVAALRPRGPGGGEGRADPVSAAAPAPGARPAPPAPPAPPPSVEPVAELPRRVRQASLVPQLREVPADLTPPGTLPAQEPPGRSPEQARDRMAAYRAGWARGSRDESPHSGSEGEV
ncbi:histidine kinase/DNA gyrase B/HSP90-like ATPase [Streptomyces sp. Ag109_G2-6]|uniref:sensor histidine kinase n=1 Tax=Streptomyces TaxID=1883 RepID=UPI0009A50010|nr:MULTISPECIES: ATP-binding protein [Streptomyces]RPF29286.1 histidine kinase/DNA gyrase B/HSP90-like ATPase [Streptomyces sp. Ag109_G2-6]